MVAMAIPWRSMAIHGEFHGLSWRFRRVFEPEAGDGAPEGAPRRAGFFSPATLDYLQKFFAPHHHHHRIFSGPQSVEPTAGDEFGE